MKDSPMVVVIPTCGRAPLLRRLMTCLARCELPEGFEGVIVVENGGTRHSADIVRYADARLKTEYMAIPGKGRSLALNYALARLDKQLVVFFDDDIRVSKRILTAYSHAVKNNKGKAFWGGGFEIDYDVAPPLWMKSGLPYSAIGWQWSDQAPWNRKTKFFGFNWAAFASDVKLVGGFNEDLGAGGKLVTVGDDTEVMSLLLIAGYRACCVQEAQVRHYVPKSRCSVYWAIKRAYTYGIYLGLGTESGSIGAKRLRRTLGLPGKYIEIARAKKIAGSEWFGIVALVGQALGEIRGYRLAKLGSDGDIGARRSRAFLSRYASALGKAKHISIFGAGSLGLRIANLLKQSGIRPYRIYDNDPGKWGKTVNSSQVMRPGRYESDEIIIVASSWAEEIRRQLSEEGLGEQKHYFLANAGF